MLSDSRRKKRRAILLIAALTLCAAAVAAAFVYNASRERAAPLPKASEAPASAPSPEAPEKAIASAMRIEDFVSGGVCLSDKHKEAHPYGVYISKNSFTIAVNGIDEEGNYTRCLRTFRTAIGTGNKTRAGQYQIREKHEWYKFSDTAYTPYTVSCTDKLRIHGPLHGEMRFQTMHRTHNYDEIGKAVTAGCLRTTCAGAAWLYYNCDVGTPVRIANDAKYVSDAPPPRKSGTRFDPTNPAIKGDFEIPVAYIEIDGQIEQMSPGDIWEIAFSEILPLNHTSKGFLYLSSDEEVATVDSSGSVRAVAPGAARIFIKADDVNGAYRQIDILVKGEAQ